MWSIFCTIKRSWSQHFVEQFSAFIILLMTYSALLFIALSLTNVQRIFEMWGKVNQVSVYFSPKAQASEKEEVYSALKIDPMVESLREVSSEESAENFEKRFSKVTSQKIDAKQVSQFFPSYFIVDLNQVLAYKSGLGALDGFANNLKDKYKTVANVSYGKSWLQRYVGILAAVQMFGWFLILSFLVASVIVSSSVIKTIIFSRRDEIEILEFIGADDSSIYLPQIINSLLLTSVSFLTANLIIYGIYAQVMSSKESLLSHNVSESISFIQPMLVVGLFFMAIIAGSLYSTLTIFNLLPRRKKALLIKGVFR